MAITEKSIIELVEEINAKVNLEETESIKDVLSRTYELVSHNLHQLNKETFEEAISLMEDLADNLEWNVSENIIDLRNLFVAEKEEKLSFKNQLARESAQDAEILDAQEEKAKVLNSIGVIVSTVVLESANLFLKTDYRKELEDVMHPAIKKVKILCRRININPRHLLDRKVHGFLDSAEDYADEKDYKMMNRVFYLVRGIAGTIGLKEQAEKRIIGIKKRARAVESKNSHKTSGNSINVHELDTLKIPVLA